MAININDNSSHEDIDRVIRDSKHLNATAINSWLAGGGCKPLRQDTIEDSLRRIEIEDALKDAE